MNIQLARNGIRICGKEEILLCSSFFYFRIPPKEWESRAKLISSLGYNCVDVYFPWNFHETEPGIFDFSEERDIERFLEICERNSLFVVARPGPYICAEWDGGGLPAWVLSEYEIRQNDKGYLAEVEKWFDTILPIIAKHQIDDRGNGCVIFLQLENELDFFDCSDAEGYIENLKKMALSNGIGVPLFVCAGQGDVKRSGGLTDGVIPAFNFYPSLSDETFDYNISQYAKYIHKRNLPFLVSETDRKHSVLKRELLTGAKLLGAYNQIGGSNFAYYQSVNNWGTPLSLICTMYDFDGIVDNLGHCTKEADEALLLSEMILVFGRKLAAAEYCEMKSPFAFKEKGVSFTNAVNLADDSGRLICVRNVNEGPVFLQSEYEGNVFEVSLDGFEALALPYHLKIDDYGIVFSNNEIFSISPLVFIRRNKPFLIIEKNGKRITITGSGTYEAIKVGFISKEEAVMKIKEKRKLSIAYCKDVLPTKIEDCLVGCFNNSNEFTKAKSSLFSENKIWYGEVEYKIKTSDRKLFLKGVGDFLTVKNDDKVVYSGLCACDDVIVDGAGDVRAIVEKWGHSNFDDARKKSLRIKTKRGIEKIYGIISQTEITRWRFTEVDSFSSNVEIGKSEDDPYISINSWNSTREPLLAAYYTEIVPDIRPGEEIILSLDGMKAECKLFLNGKYVFSFTQGSSSVNITKLIQVDEKNLLELVARKSNWAEKTGNLYMLRVVPCEFEIRTIEHLDVYNSDFEPAKLPLKLKKGKMYSACVQINVPYDTYGFALGSGFRATIMQNRKVIARIVAESDSIIQAGCPNSSKFLIPSGMDDKLHFFIEAMEDGKFEFAICEDNNENFENLHKKNSTNY